MPCTTDESGHSRIPVSLKYDTIILEELALDMKEKMHRYQWYFTDFLAIRKY